MVLSVKKTLSLVLCVSTLAASETTQTSALRTHPRRGLAGIHHTTKYAPKVVKQPKGQKKDDSELELSESDESYDSYELKDSDSVDVELTELQEMEIDTSQNLDLEVDAPIDADVELKDGEELEYDGDGDQMLDITSSDDLDVSAMASLDVSSQLESDVDLTDGTVDVELEEDEDFNQDLDIKDDEVVDEVIELPEGAKSIHLRMHKGNVDLDIIKGATMHVKKDDEHKEEQSEEAQKKQTASVETSPKEESVSYAAEAKDWIQNNSSKPVFLGGIIGAAVGIVGVAGVAIAKSRKRASEKSVLAEDVPAEAGADVEVDEDESDGDSDSDEDVEADVTAITEEDAVEEKKASVVEGSV